MALGLESGSRHFLWSGMLCCALACGKTTNVDADANATGGTGGHSGSATDATSESAVSGGASGISTTGTVTTVTSGVTGGATTGGPVLPTCENGLRVVAVVDEPRIQERGRNLTGWGDSFIAVASWDRIDYHDVSLPDSELASPFQSVSNEQLGFGEPDDIADVAAYDRALAVLIRSPNENVVLFLELNGNENVPRAVFESAYASELTVALGRIALRTAEGIVTARLEGDEWVRSGPFAVERGVPLAFVGDMLLVGISESIGESEGAAGAAGSGSGNGSERASVALMTETGELAQSFETLGNPRRAIPIDGGWAIAESNSFWGRGRAALEWLDPVAGELSTLTDVPVHSSADEEDGAFDLVLKGETLYVANCEAGLLSGTWSTESMSLSSVAAFPPKEGIGWCHPDQLAVSGDTLVAGSNPRVFARFCDE